MVPKSSPLSPFMGGPVQWLVRRTHTHITESFHYMETQAEWSPGRKFSFFIIVRCFKCVLCTPWERLNRGALSVTPFSPPSQRHSAARPS